MWFNCVNSVPNWPRPRPSWRSFEPNAPGAAITRPRSPICSATGRSPAKSMRCWKSVAGNCRRSLRNPSPPCRSSGGSWWKRTSVWPMPKSRCASWRSACGAVNAPPWKTTAKRICCAVSCVRPEKRGSGCGARSIPCALRSTPSGPVWAGLSPGSPSWKRRSAMRKNLSAPSLPAANRPWIPRLLSGCATSPPPRKSGRINFRSSVWICAESATR